MNDKVEEHKRIPKKIWFLLLLFVPQNSPLCLNLLLHLALAKQLNQFYEAVKAGDINHSFFLSFLALRETENPPLPPICFFFFPQVWFFLNPISKGRRRHGFWGPLVFQNATKLSSLVTVFSIYLMSKVDYIYIYINNIYINANHACIDVDLSHCMYKYIFLSYLPRLKGLCLFLFVFVYSFIIFCLLFLFSRFLISFLPMKNPKLRDTTKDFVLDSQ